MTPPATWPCAFKFRVHVRHSCINVILLNDAYASAFSPVARVAAPRFGLSSGHRALHGHDRWSQKRCKAITEDREEGLRRIGRVGGSGGCRNELGRGSRESRWGKSVIKKKPRWARGWISGELKAWYKSFELKKKNKATRGKKEKRYKVMRLKNF